jgi:hypothetical protein
MNKKTLLPVLVLSLFMLSACDTSADNKAQQNPVGNDVPAAEAPAGPANGYQEHTIFHDRYSSTTEIVYISPVDGKTMICTVYSTGVGAGNSCRVKE